MDLNLANKVYIVTGGAKGIGAAISKGIAGEGGIVVVVGRGKDDNIKIKYFKEHISGCKNCRKTNNENADFINFMDESIINFMEISGDDTDYDYIIEAYQSVKKYNPFGDDIEKETCKIYYIDDDDIYNHCIVIAWAQPDV